MLFTIADGTQKEIIAGSQIKLAPGYLHSYFDDQKLTVTKIQGSYPYVRFQWSEKGMDQESAVSPGIILEVL